MQEWLDTAREQPPTTLAPAERDGMLARARDVIEHIQRVVHHVRRMEQGAESAVQIHFSAQSHQTNEIMRVLTALTAVFLPLNLITGFFGMNFEFLPLIHSRHAMWVILSMMLCVGLLFSDGLSQALPCRAGLAKASCSRREFSAARLEPVSRSTNLVRARGHHLQRYASRLTRRIFVGHQRRQQRAYERWPLRCAVFRFSVSCPGPSPLPPARRYEPLLTISWPRRPALRSPSCLLVQLPPAWSSTGDAKGSSALRQRHGGALALEPRHRAGPPQSTAAGIGRSRACGPIRRHDSGGCRAYLRPDLLGCRVAAYVLRVLLRTLGLLARRIAIRCGLPRVVHLATLPNARSPYSLVEAALDKISMSTRRPHSYRQRPTVKSDAPERPGHSHLTAQLPRKRPTDRGRHRTVCGSMTFADHVMVFPRILFNTFPPLALRTLPFTPDAGGFARTISCRRSFDEHNYDIASPAATTGPA